MRYLCQRLHWRPRSHTGLVAHVPYSGQYLPHRTNSKELEKPENMRNAMLKLYVKAYVVRQALKDEHGQDLVEYALVIAVVCLGIVSGMSTLAQGINSAMATLSGKLNAAVA